jgi:uncharacterized SAM-binding protein YcdF (DUF218 family)
VGAVRRHPVLFVFLAAVLVVVGTVVVTGVAVWRAAHRDGAAEVQNADVIAVLGAAQYSGTPSPVFRGRLDHAALLYRQDRADTVVVLGANQPGDTSTEAEAGRDYLIAQGGLPAEAVVAEPVGHTSYESLAALAVWMRQRHLTSAFLVSDPWHNLRIERMASDLGFEGHASATWTSAAKTEQTRLEGYVRETFAYLYYRLFGH